MASKKPQFPVNAPAGVRKDVDPMRQTSEMADEGKNWVFFDGVVRPRPAMTPEEFGTAEVDSWQQVYNTGDKSGYHLTAYCQMNNGTIIASFINAALTTQVLSYSTDMGQHWQDTAHHPRSSVTNTYTKLMRIFDGKLWMFDLFNDVDSIMRCSSNPNTHTPVEYIYRGDLTNFPTSISFTTLGPCEWDANLIDPVWFPLSPYYAGTLNAWRYDMRLDATTGHLIVADYRASSGAPATWGLKNAQTTTNWATDSYWIDGDVIGQPVSGATTTQPTIVGDQWLAWGATTAPFGIPYITVKNYLYISSLVYSSSSGKFEFGAEDAGLKLFEGQYGNDYSKEVINIGPHEGLQAYGVSNGTFCVLEDTTYIELIVPVEAVSAADSSLRTIDIWKFTLNNAADAEPHRISEEVLYTFQGSEVTDELDTIMWDLRNVSGRLAVFAYDYGDNAMRGMTSDDDGVSWKITSKGGPSAASASYRNPGWAWNDSTLNHFVDIITGENAPHTADEWARDEIWLSPTSGGGGQLGDVAGMYQMDMDDEDEVIVVGTTRQLLRLNRATNKWDRLSADHSETSGADPWYQNGTDVPPLGVSSDRTEYASGTTINGVYGANPWVFRSFQSQDDTYLLATNGQCRPICYNYGMIDGFARRMGEVPLGDPNDIPGWDPDTEPEGHLRTGNLAPVAKCMAVGANRVLLGNIPAISGSAIDMSAFNDHDRGWGLVQTSLLGDTPGDIVGMSELSALSVAVYKEDAIYQAIAQTEFLGVAAPFRFELSKGGVPGPCGPNAILRNYDGKHIFLARDGGVYLYDGVAPIDTGRNVRRMIQGKIDLNFLGKSWGLVDTERKLVWLFYPAKGGLVNQGVVISTDQGYPFPIWPLALPQGWDFAAGGAVFLDDDISIGDVGLLGDYTTQTLSSFSSGKQNIIMGTRGNTWFSQKWEDDGDYTDANLPINIDLLGGWVTPGGAHRWTADELYHIFSSPDPEMELMITLEAQQFGEEILKSSAVPLSAGRLRRRTRHRISGTQFRVRMQGAINRIFRWGGGILTAKRSGER
jgi:hypothetical protein